MRREVGVGTSAACLVVVAKVLICIRIELNRGRM